MTKTLEQQFYGDEPIYKGKITESQLTRALNWYNYMGDPDKGRTWLMDYLKKNNYPVCTINQIKEVNNLNPTDCWLARMMSNGTTLPAEAMDRFHKRLEAAVKPKVVESTRLPTISVQERVKRINNSLITAIEGLLDDNPKFSLYDLLVERQASVQAVEAVKKYYAPHLEEVTSGDPQVAEAYGSRLTKWKRIYSQMIVDCDKYVTVNKPAVKTKVRKPRKLKVKSPADLVKKLKYLDKDTSLNVVSIDPQKIIGATQLWVFNTKYRMLGVYNTTSAKGFSVKGTTILNFDPEKSVARKLRKPQEQLKSFASQGKVGLRTFLTNIKAKDSKLTGRINGDTILLKVF
ncbi:MAG: hypothetical protein IM620_15855 [Cytophagales bacterium]|nr:hypothetical protein [Cytophagales bacterium]